MKSLNSLNLIWNNFKDPQRVKFLVKLIKKEIESLGKSLNLMEFCGGHTHVILKYGIDELLKDYVNFVHGPGCPVCVIALERVDLALELAKKPEILLCSYGDLMRVPGSKGHTLVSLRAEGYSIKAVSSSLETLKVAKEFPEKKIIFFAIGFETTAPHTAVLIKEAYKNKIDNLFVISNHILAVKVLDFLLKSEKKPFVEAIIGPGHVSTITGSKIYESIVKEHNIPIVISGFEPLDLLQAIYLIVKQKRENRCEVEVQYTRSVTKEGNPKAQALLEEVFIIRDRFPWRGFGDIPFSAYGINSKYEILDAEKRFPLDISKLEENPHCLCAKVIKGIKKPTDCKLFKKICTPQNPLGPCMVSSEGACLAYFKYKVGNLYV
ncbi:MAG: hydrogenase formation protein HypD [Thermodesulfobacteriaceae bacterium]|nr:hydrogenase formation protein HypD [Thermodesulfobacteriaceae bacterium]